MRKLFYLAFCSFVILSCKKNNPPGNTSILCVDTTFINTTIPGLQAVYFLNDKDGFVSTYTGGLYKTIDSAKTWLQLNSTTNLPIRDLYFINDQTGFAVGGNNSCGGTGCIIPGGFILRTTNGGQTWTTVYTPIDKVEISSVYFVDQALGFCAGDNIIFKTTDSGNTWTEYKVSNLGAKMMQIKFINAQKGYVACLFDKILITNDGGISWQVCSPNRDIGYYSISASNGAVFVSGQGKMIKSVDGGISWNELSNSPADMYSIHFINERIGFAFGRGNYSGGDFGHSYGAIYCTDNGGLTWNGTSDIKEVGLIQSACFPSERIGYAVSGSTVIRLLRK